MKSDIYFGKVDDEAGTLIRGEELFGKFFKTDIENVSLRLCLQCSKLPIFIDLHCFFCSQLCSFLLLGHQI